MATKTATKTNRNAKATAKASTTKASNRCGQGSRSSRRRSDFRLLIYDTNWWKSFTHGLLLRWVIVDVCQSLAAKRKRIAVAASMQGALLFGTDHQVASRRERVSFKELQRRRKISNNVRDANFGVLFMPVSAKIGVQVELATNLVTMRGTSELMTPQ